MKKPIVAIIGRPNVGKSTFFNKVVGKRISIVKDEPGVTRDRIYADAEWLNRNFWLVDTGGIDVHEKTEVNKNILHQVQIAMELADVIIMLVDGMTGLTAQDEEVATLLKKIKKPVVLTVNKCDNNYLDNLYEFYALGLGEPYPISSEHSQGVGDLLDVVVKYFDDYYRLFGHCSDFGSKVVFSLLESFTFFKAGERNEIETGLSKSFADGYCFVKEEYLFKKNVFGIEL